MIEVQVLPEHFGIGALTNTRSTKQKQEFLSLLLGEACGCLKQPKHLTKSYENITINISLHPLCNKGSKFRRFDRSYFDKFISLADESILRIFLPCKFSIGALFPTYSNIYFILQFDKSELVFGSTIGVIPERIIFLIMGIGFIFHIMP